MKLLTNDPPRVFKVGHGEIIQLKDCAHVELEPNEQVTFSTESGAEYDVARKSWGFYATPSLNGRLQKFGLRAALVKGHGRFYIFLIERGREADCQQYMDTEQHTIVAWLDSDSALDALERRLDGR